MRRREFLGLAGGAAAAWPFAARAQQSVPVVGFIRITSLDPFTHLLTAFQQGLKETGFIAGQNVAIDLQSAEENPQRLSALLADFVRRPVAVIVASGTPAVHAAKAATTTIPIVFATGADPVQEGFVPSLSRPAGNLTGVYFFFGVLGGKRLELLRQLVPKATTIGVLVNLNNTNTQVEWRDIQAASQTLRQPLVMVDVKNGHNIEGAFKTFAQLDVGAVLVGSGGFLNADRERVVEVAARHALPTSFVWREAAFAGGLMSYGPSMTDSYRQTGIYAGRLLKGEKPADLPVIASTKFDFVINLKTAKALGLEVHPQLLATTDEVIE
jgi:putative ABC transport system substrate-binding protein